MNAVEVALDRPEPRRDRCHLGWVELGQRKRYRHELLEANREMASGLHQLARHRLSALTLRSGPARPRPPINWVYARKFSAISIPPNASGRVFPRPVHSPTRPRWRRARLLMNSGRFAPAEALLLSVPRHLGPEAEQANQALQMLYHIEGRTADIRESD